jgi:hypothetical protein
MLKWDELNQIESIECLQKLRPFYDHIQAIKLVSAKTQKDVDQERKKCIDQMMENSARVFAERKEMNLRSFMSEFSKMCDENSNIDLLLKDLEKK